jgi:DNA-binding transcriptional regulator YiaG
MVDSPRILRRGQLHNLIANDLLRRKGRLAGEEIRFLRRHAGLPSGRFAALLGIDPAHLSRVENGKVPTLGVPTDRLARLVAVGTLHGSGAGSTAGRGGLRKILRELIKIFEGEGKSRPGSTVPTFKLAPGGRWKGEG